MRLPGICCECGRTIEKEFIHCPWCGCSQLEKDLVPVASSSSGAVRSASSEEDSMGTSVRLNRINSMLADLERDMMLFMIRRDKERR